MTQAFAILGGLCIGWLLCGAIWWTMFRLAGYQVKIFDFYFVWRWKRP
jgi:hypothetical protein